VAVLQWFAKSFGLLDVNYEAGYQFVRNGKDGWIMGLVLGHEFWERLELDMELYATGTFHPSENQPTVDVDARYKLHPPVILLLMAGRGLEPTRPPNRILWATLEFSSCCRRSRLARNENAV
jgi:hypothetical protein